MDGENRNTFPKQERLCGKAQISRLLAKGRHGSVSGLRYLFVADSESDVNRIMISVPKKLFKRAVKRNLLKRRIRESWRKQKHSLAVAGGMDILFIYPSKEIRSYEDIYAAVGKVIESLNARYSHADRPERKSVEAICQEQVSDGEASCCSSGDSDK